MDFKIKNRHRLKNRDIRNMLDELKGDFDCDFFSENSNVETGYYNDVHFIFIDGKPFFMYYNNKIIFTMAGVEKYRPRNRYVIVDMGAVKFVTNGADVMSPGIVDADINIKENDMVYICDEKNKKPLAIGTALVLGKDMINRDKGKAITIIHYVGDKFWAFVAKSL